MLDIQYRGGSMIIARVGEYGLLLLNDAEIDQVEAFIKDYREGQKAGKVLSIQTPAQIVRSLKGQG